jgi:regulatory protein
MHVQRDRMSNNVYVYALNLLSARAYTARNLRRKLVQKKFDPDEVEAVMERLAASRLVDDARFASEFARQKLTRGGSGVRRVRQDLIRRGLSEENIRAAIEQVSEEETLDIVKSIDAVARKKLSSMGGVAPEVARRRLFGFLARRGFEVADIRSAVQRALADN